MREDPIGPEFYVPLGTAERVSDVAFYLAAALSIVVLLVDKTTQPKLYGAVQATFAVAVIGFFVSGIVIKTYFAARAHSERFADFVSNAFSVPLVTSPSKGYYNSSADDPFLRVGSTVLENTLFSKSILAKMLRFERARICIYVFAWLWAAFYRVTDLELLTVAAQVLFSEQLLSRWVRMEWLRSRVERLYDDLYPGVAGISWSQEYPAHSAVHRASAGSVQGFLALGARLRWASYAQVGSVQCRVVFVFGIGVRYTMLFERPLEIHLFKNALAGQFGFAATLTEPNPCVFSE